MDPEFVRWLAWRVVAVIAAMLVVTLCFRLQQWDFDECLRVGHSSQFCTFNYPLAVHR